MKKTMTDILRWTLKKIAQLTILRYRPGIVGVTGSVGKTSTKLAVAAVLGPSRRTRFSRGNFNSELGLPIAIISDFPDEELKIVSRDTPAGEKRFRKAFFWMKVISIGLLNLVRKERGYPEILVLEYGADKPGDIKELIEIARPNISIITAIGETPVHVEFYSGPEEVSREKVRLIEQLPSAGFAVLNADDTTVTSLKDRTRAHVVTYGFGKNAELRLAGFQNRIEEGRPVGVSFKIEYGGSSVPVRIDGAFGKTQAYAAGAASMVGIIFGLNLVRIAESLKLYFPAPSRMELVRGAKDTLIIDSSYNASPLSTEAALDTLDDLPAKRKIAVIGDMLELGKFSVEAHEEIGKEAAKAANILVTVGVAAKIAAEAARKSGLAKKNIFVFNTADEAVDTVQGLMKKGDLILVKGSHSMELNKIVESIREV